jgi:hypothetical protein
MATSIERLTDKQVKTTKKSLNDGGNLWLLKRKDSKLWAFRYTIKGRAHKAGLGGYPAVSLASAISGTRSGNTILILCFPFICGK